MPDRTARCILPNPELSCNDFAYGRSQAVRRKPLDASVGLVVGNCLRRVVMSAPVSLSAMPPVRSFEEVVDRKSHNEPRQGGRGAKHSREGSGSSEQAGISILVHGFARV